MTALVVTTISKPNDVLRALSAGAQSHGWNFYIVGDEKTPADFELPGAMYVSVNQRLVSGEFPLNHYARKNIGYMLAMRAGADVIVETDDDNMPLRAFWDKREFVPTVPTVHAGKNKWVNTYRYFFNDLVWPRGFPLLLIQGVTPIISGYRELLCPIQQGLSTGDVDVDAIYRLVSPSRTLYHNTYPSKLALTGAWCPFNSQNTTWAREAFPLLYLPSFCSFRMTDIWRSFIAQRIAYARGWSILWHGATVHQERNAHDLMQDFEQEIPGYLHNLEIRETLERVPLTEDICDNLKRCYEALIESGIMNEREMPLLEAWIGEFR